MHPPGTPSGPHWKTGHQRLCDVPHIGSCSGSGEKRLCGSKWGDPGCPPQLNRLYDLKGEPTLVAQGLLYRVCFFTAWWFVTVLVAGRSE